MLITNIRIIDEILDVENDSIDVCIDSEDGYTFTVSIATIQYVLERMNSEKSNFFKPEDWYIIVRKLTQEIITETLEAYAEKDGFWLKLHHFASSIDNSVFDQLKAQHLQEQNQFNLLCQLDDLEDEINKLNQLDNNQKSNLKSKIEKLAQLLDS